MPANEITREAFDEALHTIFVSYSPADLDAAYKAKLKAGAYADQEAAKFNAMEARALRAELEQEPFHKCAKCNGETTRGRAYCGECSPFKGEQ
jgi:hypothetical protein